MSRKQITSLLVLFSVAILHACTPKAPPTSIATSPVATATRELSEQINLLATQTQVARETGAAQATVSSPTTAAGEAPLPGTPLPSPDLYEQVGPFKQVTLEPALVAGKVTGLQVDPDGSVLVLSESGYSRFKDGEWTGYFTEEVGPLVGIDASGRAWAVARDGGKIAAWQDDQWIPFGVNEGWITPTLAAENPVTSGIVNGPEGSLWVATTSDVRRFDGRRWEIFSPLSMGMPVTPTLESADVYTLMPLPDTRELLVGHCSRGSSAPYSGGGVRKYSQGAWGEVDASLSAGCITALEAAGDGSVWIGMDGEIRRYAEGSPPAEPVALPEAPAGYRFGPVTQVVSTPGGDLWVLLSLCEGESCYGGELLYHRTAEGWRQVGEINPAGGQKLVLDASGSPWLFSGGNAFQIIDEIPQQVPGLIVQAASVDEQGSLWLVAQSTGAPTLWKQVE